MSKHVIELNGVANILMILDYQHEDHVSSDTFKMIEEQTIMLERYMLAFTDAINKQEKPPYWHEVKSQSCEVSAK